MPNELSTAQRKVITRIVLPVSTLIGLIILLVIGMVVFLAGQQTSGAQERQRELAQGMIDVRLAELLKMTDDYAHWDEALEKLALHPDLAWADLNIGATMHQRYGVDMVFVIDPDGHTIYGMLGEARSILPIDRVLSRGINFILSRRTADGPEAVVAGLAMAEGRPALVVAAPLRPFESPVDTTKYERNVLIFVDLLDDAQLRYFSRIYKLPNLRLEEGRVTTEASAVVTMFDGTVPVHLSWDGDDPGGRMLHRMLPPLIGLLTAFAGMTAFILRQASKAADELRDTEELALRDPLTGLWNRAMFRKDLDDRFEHSNIETFALFCLDLDGFKQVNDTYGHPAGDAMISETARRLSKVLQGDMRPYRLGGDEFVIIVPKVTNTIFLQSIAARMIACISVPMTIETHLVRVGATIGIAVAPEDGASSTKIFRMADQALYTGKRAGKGCVRFHQSQVQEAA